MEKWHFLPKYWQRTISYIRPLQSDFWEVFRGDFYCNGQKFPNGNLNVKNHQNVTFYQNIGKEQFPIDSLYKSVIWPESNLESNCCQSDTLPTELHVYQINSNKNHQNLPFDVKAIFLENNKISLWHHDLTG